MDQFDLLAVLGTLKSLLQYHSSKASILRCSAFFIVQLSHPYTTTGKNIALTRRTFVGKVISLLFNTAVQVCHSFSSKEQVSFHFMAAVTICNHFGAQENKVCCCFHCFPIYLHQAKRKTSTSLGLNFFFGKIRRMRQVISSFLSIFHIHAYFFGTHCSHLWRCFCLVKGRFLTPVALSLHHPPLILTLKSLENMCSFSGSRICQNSVDLTQRIKNQTHFTCKDKWPEIQHFLHRIVGFPGNTCQS